ncbi:alpha/beta fold hydrolase [Xylophilus sp. Kf1]|nr:alpha/beta fold hydrolase [Xylophilus sp. Kf1]
MSKSSDHQLVRRGSGRAIIFVNGFGCSQSVWESVARDLETDHELIFYEYAGMGGSPGSAYDPVRYATLHGHAEDLIGLCREARLVKPVVVAHSVGTQVAILAAVRESSLFDSLVLLAPSPSYVNHVDFRGGFDMHDIDELLETLDANYFAWARMMAPVIMGNEDRPELSESLESSFCQLDPEVARHFARVIFTADHREALGALDVRTSLLQCQDDALASPEVGRYMAAHIRSSGLVALTATGHCPHISAPDEVASAIRTHLTTADRLQ